MFSYGLFKKCIVTSAILMYLETLKLSVSDYFSLLPLKQQYESLVNCSEVCCSRHQYTSYC